MRSRPDDSQRYRASRSNISAISRGAAAFRGGEIVLAGANARLSHIWLAAPFEEALSAAGHLQVLREAGSE